MVRKPRLGVFFLIDFSILAFKFDLIMILGSGSVSVKDIQTYLYNLIEAEPKSNRASDAENTENADDTDDANNTDDAENADADDVNNADNADDVDDAVDVDDADDVD